MYVYQITYKGIAWTAVASNLEKALDVFKGEWKEDYENEELLAIEKVSKVDFSEANLSGVDLYKVNLIEANLSEANLYGVNLYKANLIGVNFYKAYLTKVVLYGANLSEAIGLETCLNLKDVLYNNKTIWPSDFDLILLDW